MLSDLFDLFKAGSFVHSAESDDCRFCDFAKACEFFEAAISNNEGEASYHAQLASSLIGAKKSASKAIQAALRAIELDKYNLDYRFNLAQIYTTIGSKTNAIKIYEEILRWDEGNEVARQMLRTLSKSEGLLGKISAGSGIIGNLLKKQSK